MSARRKAEYCARLQRAARKLGQGSTNRTRLRAAQLILRIHDRLVRPPRILLLGEVNSGKSSLANLLIGEPVVPTNVITNSHFPIRFHYSRRPSLAATFRDGSRYGIAWSQIDHLSRLPVDRIDVGLPVDRLLAFEVVDTPGTGNPLRDASRFKGQWSLTHIPIWCTVAARAWKDSERAVWWNLPRRLRERGILVVTQIDLLGARSDVEKVVGRLHDETGDALKAIVPLAVPHAVVSSVVGRDERMRDLWIESGGAQLECAISRSLDELADEHMASARRLLRRSFPREGQHTKPSGSTRDLTRPAPTDLTSDILESELDSDIDALISTGPTDAQTRPADTANHTRETLSQGMGTG